MSSIKVKFGKRMKELRKSSGYTQEQLAEIISMEPTNLSKIESGIHFPQPEKIEKIATALNVSIADLFDFEHKQDKNLLLKLINDTIENFDIKKIEVVYKIISAIKPYN